MCYTRYNRSKGGDYLQVFVSKSERETEEFAELFAKKLKAGDVIAFEGDLGAGKTAFVRGMAHGMGIEARVSSPTFSVQDALV